MANTSPWWDLCHDLKFLFLHMCFTLWLLFCGVIFYCDFRGFVFFIFFFVMCFFGFPVLCSVGSLPVWLFLLLSTLIIDTCVSLSCADRFSCLSCLPCCPSDGCASLLCFLFASCLQHPFSPLSLFFFFFYNTLLWHWFLFSCCVKKRH